MEDTYKNVSSLSGEFSLEDISYGVTEKGQKYAIIRYKTNVVLHSGQKEAIDSIVAAVKIDDKQYFLDIGKADNLIY
ncbi:hypothetical protein N5853_13635 (plasmid) [Bartonella sp. HY329]|uniref:hypothetical protein n=1 Tax=unclassified Bartonella TaxID=2645622 RepID=UPI0021C9E9BA|nr:MULTISPECIES: hypothetical protein [unclassified Bartonella]UXM96575.1 hypothetical protein N5853_13635 [Bartonella sp. HY329]UXN10898.1 hypothetical protein N5852_13640 [Bartonella sp. HY328]